MLATCLPHRLFLKRYLSITRYTRLLKNCVSLKIRKVKESLSPAQMWLCFGQPPCSYTAVCCPHTFPTFLAPKTSVAINSMPSHGPPIVWKKLNHSVQKKAPESVLHVINIPLFTSLTPSAKPRSNVPSNFNN